LDAVASTGARQGELLGLRWCEVELDAGKLYVWQSYTGGRFTEPKTASGRRVIDMPAMLIAELRRWKLRSPISSQDLCFPLRKSLIFW
jgi:integrase